MGEICWRAKVNAFHSLARSVTSHPSKLVFNSALRTSEQVNPEELAQIREDIEKAKSERLMQLVSGPTSHAHLGARDGNSAMTTVRAHIDRLKTRVTRIQGSTPTDKF